MITLYKWQIDNNQYKYAPELYLSKIIVIQTHIKKVFVQTYFYDTYYFYDSA